MVLIIPTISIAHGVGKGLRCGTQIALAAHETKHADRDVYSQDPVDRARLLRKENAKMMHLCFVDSDPWDPQSIEIIRSIHAAVDVPLGVTLSEMPRTRGECKILFESGIHRVFLPLEASDD